MKNPRTGAPWLLPTPSASSETVRTLHLGGMETAKEESSQQTGTAAWKMYSCSLDLFILGSLQKKIFSISDNSIFYIFKSNFINTKYKREFVLSSHLAQNFYSQSKLDFSFFYNCLGLICSSFHESKLCFAVKIKLNLLPAQKLGTHSKQVEILILIILEQNKCLEERRAVFLF